MAFNALHCGLTSHGVRSALRVLLMSRLKVLLPGPSREQKDKTSSAFKSIFLEPRFLRSQIRHSLLILWSIGFLQKAWFCWKINKSMWNIFLRRVSKIYSFQSKFCSYQALGATTGFWFHTLKHQNRNGWFLTPQEKKKKSCAVKNSEF